jgi:glycosyltransferase involved in cell wall biosynthesis
MVRIILCSRNGEKYIGEQVRSILNQTCTDLRLLVSDDASEDRTPAVLNDIREENPDRITVIRQETPSGGACAHFLKVLSVYGKDDDYVMFSDQDDVWDPDKVERTLSAMKEAEKKYGSAVPLLVHCDSRIVGEDMSVLSPSFVRYQKMSPERNGLNQLLVQNNVTGAAMMMNKSLVSLVNNAGLPDHAVMHDHWIALTAASFGKIIFLDRALYSYRQHRKNELGAAKGSFLGEVLNRFGLLRHDGRSKKDMDRHSRETYAALFRQAAEFYRRYRGKLTPKQKRMLHAFVTMKDENRLEKILTIFRYGFTFNRFHRTIGECLFL